MSHTNPIMNAMNICKLFEDAEAAIRWMMAKKLLKSSQLCGKCGRELHFRTTGINNAEGCKWVCTTHACKSWSCSVRRGSMFAGSKASLKQAVLLLYYWGNNTTVKETAEEVNLTRQMVAKYFKEIRLVLINSIEQTGPMIGGIGTTVEIDETKITKRKHSKEWLVGGICQETKDVFLKQVERRDAETLTSVIQDNVLIGTRLVTDCWCGYNRLAQVGFAHDTVNSLNFLSPNNALIQTQNEENLWRWLKEYLKQKGTNRLRNLNEYLAEYVFRRMHPNAFESIIEAIGRETEDS
uniref:DDE_Tnp_IS1595 domain-containing protein n=1 Tax=Anopheles atroparvus TaxID=41427 RepID=A0A182J0J8_ANOAO